mmetsp:Transcript_5825/g.9908  ORF Transcript_5825/g.9908 Transcript_5825/m.9908 type:complete len:219 (+) Transcript_5825:15-671(+)
MKHLLFQLQTMMIVQIVLLVVQHHVLLFEINQRTNIVPYLLFAKHQQDVDDYEPKRTFVCLLISSIRQVDSFQIVMSQQHNQKPWQQLEFDNDHSTTSRTMPANPIDRTMFQPMSGVCPKRCKCRAAQLYKHRRLCRHAILVASLIIRLATHTIHLLRYHYHHHHHCSFQFLSLLKVISIHYYHHRHSYHYHDDVYDDVFLSFSFDVLILVSFHSFHY